MAHKNVVLPSLISTTTPNNNNKTIQNTSSSFLSKLTKYVNSLFQLQKLQITPWTVSDYKKIVIIGIHGWFPESKLVKTVVGEPIGTSQRFVQHMTRAVTGYFNQFDVQIPASSLIEIPLVGEGKVIARLDAFHDELQSKWMQDLKTADLIIFACHSQGTPVGVLLLDRLIKELVLKPKNQKICLLGMAGISHGPFTHLKSSLIIKYFEADPARELFEFNDPNSIISFTYLSAVQRILNLGVKMTLVASWYDQVVPLYSAILNGLDHPGIYRALYIDAVDYNPDFLSHLVVLALKLRNHGYSDKGLLLHLSDILSGNIYGFGTQGHSAIYDELDVYNLAVTWALNDSPISTHPSAVAQVIPFKAPPLSKLNPFILPWIMAKLTSDKELPISFQDELKSVVSLYYTWDPKTKEAKELKYRLEALTASKL